MAVEVVLLLWIIITTVKSLKKIAPIEGIKDLELMKGIWKLEWAFGLSLTGLAGLGLLATAIYPNSFGLLMLAITLGVFVLTYKATKDLEKVPIIANYIKKIDAWWAKKKKK